MSECVVTTPPTIDGDSVTFSVVHSDTGRVFKCTMTDFDSVSVTPVLRDMTPASEGESRALVAEHARDHARENPELFRTLFEQLTDIATD
jgi:hypothetical protein